MGTYLMIAAGLVVVISACVVIVIIKIVHDSASKHGRSTLEEWRAYRNDPKGYDLVFRREEEEERKKNKIIFGNRYFLQEVLKRYEASLMTGETTRENAEL